MFETKVFGDVSKGRVLVIGHDPGLQQSRTVAEYCFFADYFFKPIPTQSRELAKYKFANSLFSYIGWLTSYKYAPNELIITNLCNKSLRRAPEAEGKTILIPEEYAKEGLENIKNILKSSQIEIILAMSQQVNYWLQKLGFYSSTENYLEQSRPKEKAAQNHYYEPVGKSPFLEICGNKYCVGTIPLFPVLHLKQYPLRGGIKKNYEAAHRNCINSIKEL